MAAGEEVTRCSEDAAATSGWPSTARATSTRSTALCHTFGIPLIAVSLALFVVAWFVEGFWPVPATLFVLGWVLQFVGHAVEGKPPEFFKDPRFLLVGLRWWFAKMRGKA